MTGLEKQAEIIEVERNFKLFYVFVDKAQGTKFDIIGYAADGSIKHKETTMRPLKLLRMRYEYKRLRY